MTMGRPSKYNDEILEQAKLYLSTHKDEGDEVPIVAGLACFLGIAKSTVYKWAEEHKDFSDTLDDIQAKQERILASGGLTGMFNSTITKLMLHNHGYSDNQKTELSGGISVIGIKDDFGE